MMRLWKCLKEMMINMNYLIDTHIAIFAMANQNELAKKFTNELANLNNRVFVSIASIWEVVIKSNKHPDKIPINEKQFIRYCEEMEFEFLPIKIKHITNIRNLKLKNKNIIHKDPFDRLLISQSQSENLIFCTRDTVLLNYDVTNIKIV